jgi:hypothetical protein
VKIAALESTASGKPECIDAGSTHDRAAEFQPLCRRMHVIDDDSEFAVVIKIALFDFARCATTA